MLSDGYVLEEIINTNSYGDKDPYIPMIMLDLGTHLHHLVSMATVILICITNQECIK